MLSATQFNTFLSSSLFKDIARALTNVFLAARAMEGASNQAAMPSTSTAFDEYQPRLQKAALASTRLSNVLPGPEDMAFQRTLDRKFSKDIEIVSKRVFSMTNKLLMFARGPSNGKGKSKDILLDEEDLLGGFHTNVVDIMDQLFEAAVRNFSNAALTSQKKTDN